MWARNVSAPCLLLGVILSLSATPHGQVPMPLVATQLCSASGVLIRLSRCVNSLYLVSGRLSRVVCHLLVCHCSAPRWRFTRRLTGEQAARWRSGLSSSDVITIAHRWSGVKWTVERSGTVLPKTLGMIRFLNVLNKGWTDYLTLAPRVSAYAHTVSSRGSSFAHRHTSAHPLGGKLPPSHYVIGLRNFCQNINLPLQASTSPFNAHHTCRYTKERLYAR